MLIGDGCFVLIVLASLWTAMELCADVMPIKYSVVLIVLIVLVEPMALGTRGVMCQRAARLSLSLSRKIIIIIIHRI